MGEYCCESMLRAVEDWGGVWWEDEKWHIEQEFGGEVEIGTIAFCPWCKTILGQGSEDK